MSSLVSIVIPFLNHNKFVERCWENLRLQTYPNTEIIFVNNGSTDGSEMLIEKLVLENPEKIKLVRELQPGIPFARNKGIAEAKGEYISFLDVDDLLPPEKLSTLHDALEKNPEAAMAYGQTLRIYTESDKKVIQDTGDVDPGINNQPKLAIDWIKSFYHLPQTGSTLVKTSVAKQIGGFPENLLLGNDDVGFHLQIALKYQIIFVPFIAVHYFRHIKSEGARLNDEKSVHYRYLDAITKYSNPVSKNYFRETGDMRLWGLAQRSQFLNYLNCIKVSRNINFPDMEFFSYYRFHIFLFKILPFSAAMFIYKITRRMIYFFAPEKFPLR